MPVGRVLPSVPWPGPSTWNAPRLTMRQPLRVFRKVHRSTDSVFVGLPMP